MPSSIEKRKLSGSTDGQPIAVAATASPGTTIHTAVAGTTAGTYDEIWLWATNTDTSDRKLSIQWGGTATVNLFELTIPPEAGAFLVCPGWILQNGLLVRAFASVASVVNIIGFVNAVSA